MTQTSVFSKLKEKKTRKKSIIIKLILQKVKVNNNISFDLCAASRLTRLFEPLQTVKLRIHAPLTASKEPTGRPATQFINHYTLRASFFSAAYLPH